MLKQNPKTIPGQSGFTVIEVLITLFMIGASLVLFQATTNSIILNRQGGYKEIALRIADKKIQTIRTTPFASIPASGSFADPALASLPNGQANLTVTDASATLKDVTVTVSWTHYTGTGTSEIKLQTYVLQGGLGQ